MDLSENIEHKIITYYLLPKSMNDTVKAFKLKNRYQLKKLLQKYNITPHGLETVRRLNAEATKEGCMLKYGVPNCMQATEIAAKTRKTLLSRTQTEVDLATLKQKQTKSALYGDETFNNRAKAAITNLERYGTKTPIQNKQIADKIKETNLQKYGVENVFQAEAIKDKICSSVKAKYGEMHYTKTLDYIEKTKATCIAKYQTDWYVQSLDYAHKAHKKYVYQNINFDSSWELAVWIYAQDHGMEIVREPVSLMFNVGEKSYYCIPDFRLNGQLIEIKGSQFIKNGTFVCPYNIKLNTVFEAKQKCLQANNVLIWQKADIQFALDYINDTYGRKYLRQFKNRTDEPKNK